MADRSQEGQSSRALPFAHIGQDSCMWVYTGRGEAIPTRELQRYPLPLGHDSSMWFGEDLVSQEDTRSMGEPDLSERTGRIAITKKMKSSKKASAAAGWHPGGATPFGYRRRFDPIDGRAVLVKDKREASIVVKIFRAYIKTASLEKVRRQLDAAGITNTNGKGWSRSSLAFLLSNRTYTGQVKYCGEGHVGRHEAIVTEELFEAAKQIRMKKCKRRR